MLKKRNAAIIGLTSITLFAGCIAFINNADNQNKAIPESFGQVSNSQFSEVVAPTTQGGTQVFPSVVPMPTNAATASLPTPTEQPPVATPEVKINASETPTPSIKSIPSTLPPTPSIKAIPPTTTTTTTTTKATTTKTRAS